MLKQRKSQAWRRFGYPVLISIDFDDFTSPFTPSFLFRLRRYIKHSRQCFIGYPNTSNFVKNTPLRVIFSTLFSVFGYPDETLSLVFDILLLKLIIHAALTQLEHLILVRWMGLETQWKTNWKHGRVWNPCLKRFQKRMQIFLTCILIKQQKHVVINNFI